MIRVGITGQAGFIGTHLTNFLGTKRDEIEIIPFADRFFQDHGILESFVKQCDVIVHLAAMNRHNDPDELYQTNLQLVTDLISACEAAKVRPNILFSSSSQEERNNPYGKSKREGRLLFEKWARENDSNFAGLIIPNVYGPFGNPYYNSVIATFCHQLTHGETPKIEVDSNLRLIYVTELVQKIYELLIGRGKLGNEGKGEAGTISIPHTAERKVSEILDVLTYYKRIYFEQGIFPDLSGAFEKNLFNTFSCYIDYARFFPFYLTQHTDVRGTYAETVKFNSGGQVAFSTTNPGITRGNHYHTRKAERFAIIKGQARIQLRRIGTDKIMSFELDGTKPSFVDMPVWHTHNITNTGTEDLYTLFWINEHYDPEDTDTFYEEV